MLDYNDINIFTIVKDKNHISPIRQYCIDSWKKYMPGSNIMIFDDNDLFNPNWEYHDVVKDDYLMNTFNDFNTPHVLKPSICLDRYSKSLMRLNVLNTMGGMSTDSIRLKLLQHIPNALYIDSDTIMTGSVLDYCNKYDNFINDPYNYIGEYGGVCTCFGIFVKDKSEFISNFIKFYNSSKTFYFDDAAMIAYRSLDNNDYDMNFINITGINNNNLLIHLHMSSVGRYGEHLVSPENRLVKIFYTFQNVYNMGLEDKRKLNSLLLEKSVELGKQNQRLIYLMSKGERNLFRIFDSVFDPRIRIYLYEEIFDKKMLELLKLEIPTQTRKCVYDENGLKFDLTNIEFEEITV